MIYSEHGVESCFWHASEREHLSAAQSHWRATQCAPGGYELRWSDGFK